VVDDVVIGFEDAVREPVIAHELPDILDRAELGASRRQRQQGDVGRHDQFGRRARAALGPEPGELGLLPDPGFILPPQLYGRSLGKALKFDFDPFTIGFQLNLVIQLSIEEKKSNDGPPSPYADAPHEP
jgi:hypothetical protein